MTLTIKNTDYLYINGRLAATAQEITKKFNAFIDTNNQHSLHS